MKKKLILSLALVLFITGISYVSADTKTDVTLNSGDSTSITAIVKEDLKTVIKTGRVLNAPVNVENTIQRKNSSGNWTNVKRYVIPVKANTTDTQTYNLYGTSYSGTVSTRSIWYNMSVTGTVVGDFTLTNN